MRWKDGRRSNNIEDRRGQRSSGFSGGGGGARSGLVGALAPMLIRMIMGRKRGSIWLIVGGVAVAWFMGINPMQLLGMAGGGGLGLSGNSQQAPARGAGDDELSQFVSVVLADTEDTWAAIFQSQGQRYQAPGLVLFTDATKTACGQGQAAMGPFYCPGDRKVYIDLSFYKDLRTKLGAPGDFAQAYVIAHEVGHHLQTLDGTSKRVHSQRSSLSKAQGNVLSVKQELQADCYAGVWAYHAQQRGVLEPGDIGEAMTAAEAIGDDRLQQQAGRRVQPESFTHGTSAQRQHWFNQGLKTGQPAQCDTFNARSL